MNELIIVEQQHPRTLKPYRLLEILDTSEGPRFRVCSGQWATIVEAHTEIEERRQRFYKELI